LDQDSDHHHQASLSLVLRFVALSALLFAGTLAGCAQSKT
jgi:hypothetical protein